MKKLVLLLLVAFITGFSAIAETYVVNVTKANVRAKASTNSKIIGTIQQGIEINVLETVNGFAHFDFMGTPGYTSIKLLKKVESTPVEPTIPVEPEPLVEEQPVSNTEATIYFFYDVKNYIKSMPVYFNGEYVFGMEGKETTSKMTGTRYEPSMRKITIHGEGRLLIALDFEFSGKPWHSELTIDVADGSTYYIQAHIENLINFITKKRGGIYLKQLKPKDGLKMLKKDKWTVNPDFEYNLK